MVRRESGLKFDHGDDNGPDEFGPNFGNFDYSHNPTHDQDRDNKSSDNNDSDTQATGSNNTANDCPSVSETSLLQEQTLEKTEVQRELHKSLTDSDRLSDSSHLSLQNADTHVATNPPSIKFGLSARSEHGARTWSYSDTSLSVHKPSWPIDDTLEVQSSPFCEPKLGSNAGLIGHPFAPFG